MQQENAEVRFVKLRKTVRNHVKSVSQMREGQERTVGFSNKATSNLESDSFLIGGAESSCRFK